MTEAQILQQNLHQSLLLNRDTDNNNLGSGYSLQGPPPPPPPPPPSMPNGVGGGAGPGSGSLRKGFFRRSLGASRRNRLLTSIGLNRLNPVGTYDNALLNATGGGGGGGGVNGNGVNFSQAALLGNVFDDAAAPPSSASSDTFASHPAPSPQYQQMLMQMLQL
eukprot:CAMPEP_0175044890 /NCGR_PEP_ID=MMETSP0052_2-20121109/4083_1 /TAXON_ID=51329 ORGANISM="Polytomella parva, Strain SAG 63-3" /NCGR_SAMPLE_ID=MMETSP0052_2 /ASSEMBLY_ACC=CAM_ASM_000194 /LENGTH=162 /DNA_ID=CAMNT_0016308289 /DNA_START=77 /DNA_END=562 /DNA_ORIENTATION=+